MPVICGKCYAIHPSGALGCEDARRIREKNAEEFNRKVTHHREHCRGCSDPAQHVMNLDKLDNPSRRPIRFA